MTRLCDIIRSKYRTTKRITVIIMAYSVHNSDKLPTKYFQRNKGIDSGVCGK